MNFQKALFVALVSTFAIAALAADHPADRSGKDYHLVATQLRGAPAIGTPAEFPVVYVLLYSDENGDVHPTVYKEFDSRDMELDLRGLVRHGDIAPGSVLHFDPKPDLERPTEGKIRALEDFCKEIGITLEVGKTA